jgi:hypothetical protein
MIAFADAGLAFFREVSWKMVDKKTRAAPGRSRAALIAHGRKSGEAQIVP